MKDKLVKTGHKKMYYRFRALSFVALGFLGASAALAAPIAISVGTNGQPLFAQNGNEEKEVNVPEESEENNPYVVDVDPQEN